MDELLGVLPLVYGDDIFLGDDDPKPTGVGGSFGRLIGVPELLVRLGMPPPDLMLEDRRTELPRGPDSSEFRERLDPGFQTKLASKDKATVDLHDIPGNIAHLVLLTSAK